MPIRRFSPIDHRIALFGRALATLAGSAVAGRPNPAGNLIDRPAAPAVPVSSAPSSTPSHKSDSLAPPNASGAAGDTVQLVASASVGGSPAGHLASAAGSAQQVLPAAAQPARPPGEGRLTDVKNTDLSRSAAEAAGGRPAADPATAGAAGTAGTGLSPEERRLSAALMRVNHVGEVCAQALYESQALTARDPALREGFLRAAAEEGDHLGWTRQRLDELGGRPSLLNPLWYGGAFMIGALAGRLGDRFSLGFMAETERQVERHLAGHLQRLPAGDLRSRAILQVMASDERAHADAAIAHGGVTLPAPVRGLMRLAAKVMTRTAHHV